jgi:hypothetical protein
MHSQPAEVFLQAGPLASAEHQLPGYRQLPLGFHPNRIHVLRLTSKLFQNSEERGAVFHNAGPKISRKQRCETLILTRLAIPLELANVPTATKWAS